VAAADQIGSSSGAAYGHDRTSAAVGNCTLWSGREQAQFGAPLCVMSVRGALTRIFATDADRRVLQRAPAMTLFASAEEVNWVQLRQSMTFSGSMHPAAFIAVMS